MPADRQTLAVLDRIVDASNPQEPTRRPGAGQAPGTGCPRGGRRRLPEANVRRFRNRLRGLRDRWAASRPGLVLAREGDGFWPPFSVGFLTLVPPPSHRIP